MTNNSTHAETLSTADACQYVGSRIHADGSPVNLKTWSKWMVDCEKTSNRKDVTADRKQYALLKAARTEGRNAQRDPIWKYPIAALDKFIAYRKGEPK